MNTQNCVTLEHEICRFPRDFIMIDIKLKVMKSLVLVILRQSVVASL